MTRRNCRTPAETWAWLSPDDVLADALAAVFAARRSVAATDGEPWLFDGTGWQDREGYGTELVRAFAAALDRRAAAAGLDEAWLQDGGYLLPSGCRGGAPAVMGHGWPASAAPAQPGPSAVGPAHAELRTADITLTANPLFCASTVQELPVSGDSDNVRDNHGGNA